MGTYLNASHAEDLFWKVLVYGPTGSGKSTLGVTAPDPVILLSEFQGFASIADAAKRLNKPLPPTFWLQSADDMRNALTALRSKNPIVNLLKKHGGKKKDVDALPYLQPKTVVIDSTTEFFQLICDEIDDQSPPTMGSDGLPARSMRFWGVLGDRSQSLIRGLRDLPYHVLFLALVDDREVGEGEEKSRIYQPLAPMRSIAPKLAAAVNVVGVSRVRQVLEGPNKDAKLQWGVKFTGPSWQLTKPKRPLRDFEAPDFSAWCEKLSSEPENLKGES